MTKKLQGDLQDGLLSHYQAQARASDSNVEARLEREPFDYREYIRRTGDAYPGTLARAEPTGTTPYRGEAITPKWRYELGNLRTASVIWPPKA